jgi:PTS system cellobiose-specific IIA component
MVHGQDHLMNAITFKDMAVELIALMKRVSELEDK